MCHGLACSVLEPPLDLPSTQGHGRTVSGSEPPERGAQRGSATRTLKPPAQLLGGEDDGQLALAVGRLRVILPLLPVQVLEVYVPSNVGQGRDVDDARGGGGFQLVQQQVRQKEVAWKKENRKTTFPQFLSRAQDPTENITLWPPSVTCVSQQGPPLPSRRAFGKVWRQSSSSELRTEWECYCHLVGGARDAAKNPTVQELPGGLVVRMLGFHCCSLGAIPAQQTEILRALWCTQKKKKKKSCNTQNSPHN